ncbi:MAG: non-canonical purine NTP diphosphatase [Bacteroidales bacterium]|nr:non-canonical purine NTP diphosphatase [Bacteroidales bacterium]
MELVFATNNKYKLQEIQKLLGKKFKLLSLKDIGIEEDVPENQNTIKENASQKAFYIYKLTKKNCFADDTGLEVEALNGQPGVKSARYAGDDKNSENNIAKLLNSLKDKTNRKAKFRTIITLILNDEKYVFEGICNGEITESKRGKFGFGYDPVFIPEGYNQTFAQMKMDEKNKISHRAIAFNKLLNFLNNYINSK